MCKCDFNNHRALQSNGYLGFGQIPDLGQSSGFGQISQNSLWGCEGNFPPPPPEMNSGMFGGCHHGPDFPPPPPEMHHGMFDRGHQEYGGHHGHHDNYFFDDGFGDSKMGKGLGKAAVKSAEYNGIANIIGASTGIVGIFANWFSK